MDGMDRLNEKHITYTHRYMRRLAMIVLSMSEGSE